MEAFDFHSLARKELQALCKQNKIPANLTNVAMADSLRALPQVEGLDELLEALKSDPPRSPGKTVPGTPVVPQSGRRSTIRSKAAVVEPVTRTRRTTRKTAAPEAGAVADTPVTTAVSRRKVPVPAASKFSLDAEGEGVGGVEKIKAASVAESIQKGSSSSLATSFDKDERSVQKVYSSRRSVRLLEKSMAKICLKDDAEKNEGVAGGDSFIAPKEETHGSCRNLDSLLENETEIKDGVSADHHPNNSLESVKSIQEENVEKNTDAVEPLPEADYYTENEAPSNVNMNGSIDETVSLEDVEKTKVSLLQNETEMSCDLQEDECIGDEVDGLQEKQCIELVDCDNKPNHEADHLHVKAPEAAVDLNNESLQESEPEAIPVELSNPDASSIGNHSLDTETDMNDEVQLNSKQLGYEVEEPIAEVVIGSNESGDNLLGSPNLSDWSVGSFDEWLAMEQQQKVIDEAGTEVVSTPRPVLKSIVVMGSNSHHVSSSAALHSEDTSAAVTETKPTDDEMEYDDEEKLDGVHGDVEVDTVEVVTSTETAASLISGDRKLSSPFAADALQGQFPRPTTTVTSQASSAKKQATTDIASSEMNKENIGNWKIKMEEEETEKDDDVKMKMKKGTGVEALEELSMRQLTKMLKEKLNLANNKAEKVPEKRRAMKTLSDNCMSVGEPDRKN